jgi:hypothetical protein
MNNFHYGLLVGFFLGALVMFVVGGIIQLYAEERRKHQDGSEIRPTSLTRCHPDRRFPDHLTLTLAVLRQGEETAVYLMIVAE